jgi:hypothetical protein
VTDFFNNVAAVAAVLMFAKVVTHHLRRELRVWPGRAAVFHAVGVGAAVLALIVALLASDHNSAPCVVHVAAGALLAVAAAVLLVDEIFAPGRERAAHQHDDVGGCRTQRS